MERIKSYRCKKCLKLKSFSSLLTTTKVPKPIMVSFSRVSNICTCNRDNFDEYFMKICNIVATRATCSRKSVGCVIVKNNRILSTGYNGAPKGFKHCTEVGCKKIKNHCVRVVHAEMNALLFAGVEAEGGTLYSNVLPCDLCMKLAVQAGIERIVYHEDYNKSDVQWIIDEARIEIVKI